MRYPVGDNGAFDVFPHRGVGGVEVYVSGAGFFKGKSGQRDGGARGW